MKYVHKFDYVFTVYCAFGEYTDTGGGVRVRQQQHMFNKEASHKHGMQNSLLVIYTWHQTRCKCLNSNFHHSNNAPIYQKWVFVITIDIVAPVCLRVHSDFSVLNGQHAHNMCEDENTLVCIVSAFKIRCIRHNLIGKWMNWNGEGIPWARRHALHTYSAVHDMHLIKQCCKICSFETRESVKKWTWTGERVKKTCKRAGKWELRQSFAKINTAFHMQRAHAATLPCASQWVSLRPPVLKSSCVSDRVTRATLWHTRWILLQQTQMTPKMISSRQSVLDALVVHCTVRNTFASALTPKVPIAVAENHFNWPLCDSIRSTGRFHINICKFTFIVRMWVLMIRNRMQMQYASFYRCKYL